MMKDFVKGMFSISAKELGKEVGLAVVAAVFTFGAGYYIKKKFNQDKKQ